MTSILCKLRSVRATSPDSNVNISFLHLPNLLYRAHQYGTGLKLNHESKIEVMGGRAAYHRRSGRTIGILQD